MINGRWDLGGQYHYTMETHTCVAVPTEDHLEVFAATQWPTALQETLSEVLNLPENFIDVRVRRLGGGYGAKITRANHVGAVAALGAVILNRPVRVVLDLQTNAEWCGKRFPVSSKYQAGVNAVGEIQYLNLSVYQDEGYSPNEAPLTFGGVTRYIKSGYNDSHWNIVGYGVRTDTASNTWCRAPGSTEAISIIENVMEHISKVTGQDPISVRLENMNDKTLAELTKDVRKSSDYDIRLKGIKEFNKVNRWKKRGISLVPMKYPFRFWGNFYGTVDIFGMDGSVALVHGAIEMGQGVNTKAAQVAAHVLGVPLERVTVKPTMTVTSPNNVCTGGSIGSEAVCYAIKVCCENLNERLRPIREKLGEKATWQELCREAIKQSINLSYTHMFTNKDDVKSYSIYGVTVIEVEVDILTGQYQTLRVDLLEDAGESLSPEVDIGQVEGAFVMGLGYYTCEELIYSPETGRLLTNRTWNYKTPGAKDIPIDLRITLRKNAPNPTGVLRSKATGEPPLCMSCSVVFAIRNALLSARKDAGNNDVWFDLDAPFTGEKIWSGALTRKELFYL